LGILSYDQARRAYDRIGLVQDLQWFYEDTATVQLKQQGDFQSAESVYEFGCGTGRFARSLFRDYLSGSAHYRGADVSPRMIGLATKRLDPWAEQVELILSDGSAPVDELDGAYDRFVSNFVFDLLSDEDTRTVLAEAHRILRPGGLLCLSGLSSVIEQPAPLARAAGWIHEKVPALLGGCRPVDLRSYLGPEWECLHFQAQLAFGIPSEAMVYRRR
jgi:ubiquinone/menaquinone biosynthesis C-methylase UbiE